MRRSGTSPVLGGSPSLPRCARRRPTRARSWRHLRRRMVRCRAPTLNKPVGALGSGVGVLSGLHLEGVRLSTEFHRVVADRGVVTDTSPGTASPEFVREFVTAIAAHRHWNRPPVGY